MNNVETREKVYQSILDRRDVVSTHCRVWKSHDMPEKH